MGVPSTALYSQKCRLARQPVRHVLRQEPQELRVMQCRLTRLRAVIAFSALLYVAAIAPAAEPRVEDVAFTAKCDGTTQNYVLVYPEGFKPDEPHPLLIALHGHGSDRWQFVKGAFDEARAARDAAAAHNMLFVSPDYRKSTSWMGPKAEADLLQIIDELKARFRVGKVIVCGGSMGGSSTLTFAAMHPERTDGAVSMNGTANHLEYNNFQDAIAESFGGPKAKIPGEYKKRSAEYWPERLTMPHGHHGGRQGRSSSAGQRDTAGRHPQEASTERVAAGSRDRRPHTLMPTPARRSTSSWAKPALGAAKTPPSTSRTSSQPFTGQQTTYPAHAVCRSASRKSHKTRHTACAGYVSRRERLQPRQTCIGSWCAWLA